MSTPSVASMISGVVRWDKNGSGTFELETHQNSAGDATDVSAEDDVDKPFVEGETVALYDGQGHLLQTTRTDMYGRYALFPNTVLGSQTFIVRLVQPQVNAASTAAPDERTDPDDPSKTIHVVSILKRTDTGDTPRLTSGADGMRNAVQSWALTDGVIQRFDQVNQGSGDDATFNVIRVAVRNNAPEDQGMKISLRAACFAPKSDSTPEDESWKRPNAGGTSAHVWNNCYGALPARYIDSTLTDIGGTTDINQMPIRTRIDVTMNSFTTSFDAQADFGITAVGSYGDSASPFNSMNRDSGPYLTGVDPNNLRLGANPAKYTDGVTNDSHSTDDGVRTEKGSLKGLRPNKNGLIITVHGPRDQALSYRLVGWLVPKNGKHDDIKRVFSTAPKSIAANASEDITVHFSDWKDTSGNAIDLQPGTYLLRIMAVPEQLDTTDSDNTNKAYDGPAFGDGNANTKYWTNPGEIEDYEMTVNDQQAIIRFQTLIESRSGWTVSLPKDVTYWPGGSRSIGRNPNFKTYSVGSANEFLPGIDAFEADSAMTLPQYVFEDAASSDYHFMTSNRLWYDANYENPNVPDEQKSTVKGMVCFEHDDPGNDEPGQHPLGALVAPPTNPTAAPTFMVRKISQTDRQDKSSQVQEGVNARIDHTNEWDIIMRPRNLTNHEDVIVTCQVPLRPAQMILPNTGATTPWMLIAGSVTLLAALGAIAAILVLRRRG